MTWGYLLALSKRQPAVVEEHAPLPVLFYLFVWLVGWSGLLWINLNCFCFVCFLVCLTARAMKMALSCKLAIDKAPLDGCFTEDFQSALFASIGQVFLFQWDEKPEQVVMTEIGFYLFGAPIKAHGHALPLSMPSEPSPCGRFDRNSWSFWP